ncbi:MAG TPA: DUF1593 domain-containing protein [Pyrinomonadaceae bacterium]|nr:DUF1593 domain-containing protein [Pyrinomonadaceae bacterium]
MTRICLFLIIGLLFVSTTVSAQITAKEQTKDRFRVIVSSDIGGTDPDDFQSMVHFLVYADMFDIEGLVSSPYGPGRQEHIREVINYYEKDFPNLKTYSSKYPTPDELRAITKQGAIDTFGPKGYEKPTEGSEWIIKAARKTDKRPLYLMVWGGIDDLAQALHDAPDILPKLRVYFIGGPNKMWSVDAYNYIETNHPKLWMIEANSTYRGFFVGGDQSGDWGNSSFVSRYIAGKGELGNFFNTQLKGTIKMGDTPAVGWLLKGDPTKPTKAGWGGKFVRLWQGRKTIFNRLTTEADQAEAFGVVEFLLPIPEGLKPEHQTQMLVDGRVPAPGVIEGNKIRFRFSPRDAKVWSYSIKSKFAAMDGQTGKFTAVMPSPEKVRKIDKSRPNWWIDDFDPAAAEGIHWGAKSVNQWRKEFLSDFALRMERCVVPKK